MAPLPSLDERRPSLRAFHLSPRTRVWTAISLLVMLAAGASVYFTRDVLMPTWLVMVIFLGLPAVALVLAVIALFSMSRDWWIKSASPAEDGQSRPHVSLFLDALQVGSQAWAWCFVVVSSIAYSLAQIIGLPHWLRVPIALAPLVPLAMYLHSTTRKKEGVDELAMHIRREAYFFVYLALIGLFVCVHLLDKAGVLPDFRWSSTQLVGIMIALLIVGSAISSRRFR